MSSATANYTNPGSGINFSVEDLSGTGAGPYFPRSQIVGSALAEIAAVKNAAPASNAYGLIVRAFLVANDGTQIALGQAVKTASLPVVIASDQGNIGVTVSQALALDATLTGGTAKAINRGGAKGTTAAADITSTAEGANNQAMDVQLYHGGVAKDPTAVRALTAADIVTVQQGTSPWVNNITQIGGTNITLGQKASASAFPIVLASDGLFTAQSQAGYIRPRKLVTYRASYRLAARPYALSKTFTANTRVQFATIHHAATAVKTLKLRHVWIAVESNTVAAAILMFDLMRITSAPATGNPAITPATVAGGTAAEATCLALPTTAGTEAGAPWAFQEYNVGITGAVPTVNPPQGLVWCDLMVNCSSGVAPDHEKDLPQIAAGVLGGWSVTVDANAASTLKAYVVIEFTEE